MPLAQNENIKKDIVFIGHIGSKAGMNNQLMIHSLRIQIQLTLAQGENVKKVKLIFCHVVVTQLEEQSTNDT